MSDLQSLRDLRSGDGVTLTMLAGKIKHFGVHATLWYQTHLGQIHRSVVRRWVTRGWVTEPRGCARLGVYAVRRYRLTDEGRDALESTP